MNGPDLQQTLVLVDPDSGVRDALADLLELEGYEVLPAAEGRCAIEHVARERAHLVIIAASLPIRQRQTLALRLKEWETPVIVIGGAAGVAPDLPTVSFPIDVTKLIALIDATLDAPRNP